MWAADKEQAAMNADGAKAERYLVGCWTFTDPDRALATPACRLDVAAQATIGAHADHATAVYYGAVEPGGRSILLLHNDLHRSSMSRQRFDENGKLVELGRWSSGGDGGSYIAFDRTGAYFAVANARGRRWTVFRNGDTPEIIAQLTHEGKGPHPRQAHSHPHCIVFSPDNCWLYAADMGADAVLAFPFDAASGQVGEKRLVYRAAPGLGPRHILFHRGLAYLLCELGNRLIVLRPGADGMLQELQGVDTLPDGFTGDSHTAHLAVGPGDDLILVSNRGHDSIVGFALGADGLVVRCEWTASGGKWPWFFLVTATGGLLVANTLSDTITQFARDVGGKFIQTGSVAAERPAFIAQF
ncbi:beta-propeller fold lactonase family protein [Novosphingobium flavum]|uniref:Beta-propeller fold lactonase family protein n=1 Tax=Novosphingobium flavum TaxID=1778672 RepID=A0A7X1FTR9_9SPHN|nr:beta-propeller fold lactonase family protein [Novosphingobium flavum]MBC2666684.1 beta-propeller fold lactonase family protein [Novosphingobium flavum]